jgi:hypothetical protein
MSTITQGAGRTGASFGTSGIIASLVGKWREYRMLRDAEALPYAIMKDIGFRAADRANAK